MKSFLQILLFFLLVTQIHYPQWTNQNPVPDGNDLWSTFFVDDNTGWIVGSDGFIKKTTNAGVDWVQQNSGTTSILKSVQFVDLNLGWICGESGLILKTTNGGLNWFSLASGTTEHLTDIHFCNDDTGYAAGFNGTIIKTTNAGSFWMTQSSGTSNNLNSIDFVNALLGYVVISANDSIRILKTTDGGINWIEKVGASAPAEVRTINFIDANTGFVGGGYTGASQHEFICKTTDGGDTWVKSTFIVSPPLFKQKEHNHTEQLEIIYSGGGINSIHFKDSNIGYAVSGFYGWNRTIYTSTDGGSNWQSKYWGWEEDGLLSVYGNSQGQAWAVGIGGVIFITEDDGNSWAQILSGNNAVRPYCGDFIYSVFMINENVGWASGRRNKTTSERKDLILKTTNAGKIWKTQYQLTGLGEPGVTSIYFINEDIGWAVRDTRLFHTTDGGENWSTIFGIGGSSVFFIDQNTGWVANDINSNGIYKSTDGGITWTQKSSVSSSSVYFLDINIGWAVGAGGSILKSTDGGETWVVKTSGTTNDLNCIKFYDLNLGICVGNGGTVLLSSDGGESWNPQSSGTTEDLTSMAFTSSTSAWIAGFNGKILSTTDTGLNWTPHDGITSNDLTSLFFINEYTGWVGGDNNIYKYSVEPPLPPVWSNQITVEDAGRTESSQVVTFGQHLDATDSIDAPLDEYELPPPPFPGIFDSRFNLPTNPQVSSLTDYRDSAKTDVIWEMTFQPGSAGYPMIFTWDSTAFPTGTFYLKDIANGSFVFVNMKGQSSYTLSEQTITALNISYRGFNSIVSVNNEWNMISVPLLAEDMTLGNLFPTATSLAYSYSGGYISENTLAIGRGYWLKFGANEEIQIYGLTQGDTVSVQEGWNMFGVYEKDILINQITTTPPGIVATNFFGFNDGYYIEDTLKSGQGYWVRVAQDGVLNLNGGSLTKDVEKEKIAAIVQDWGRIKIIDSRSNTVTLYATEEEADLNFYELPPVPPSGIFDARYNSGRILENLSSEKIILVSSDSYPITIRAEGINITLRDRINGELLNEELTDGKEIRITNSKITSILVTGRVTEGLPVSYELYQNYPNPFNPNTTIKFAIPQDSDVDLTIYDILGNGVIQLIDKEMKTGYHQVEFDASQFASGVYLYRIKAGSFVETKKMVLLR